MAGRNFLFVPGPTNVPDRILRAMDRAMEDHRSSAFPALATELLHDLKHVFKTTTGQAFIFPATGTGGWEAALVNTLSPGDRVLAPRYGQFSHLWIDLAQRHGLRVDIIDVEWGEGAPVARIEDGHVTLASTSLSPKREREANDAAEPIRLPLTGLRSLVVVRRGPVPEAKPVAGRSGRLELEGTQLKGLLGDAAEPADVQAAALEVSGPPVADARAIAAAAEALTRQAARE